MSGYPSRTSVRQGGSIGFRLSADPPGTMNLKVERFGLPPLVSTTFTSSVGNYPPPATSGWLGFNWPVAYTFVVPSVWPSGLYVLTYNDGAGDFEILTFVVLPASPGGSSVLLQISYVTPQAYNPAGGKSLYGFNSGGESSRASVVSLDRPCDPIPPDTRLRPLIPWLEQQGIVVEYCSSIDVHADPNLLSNYECLVIAGHDEYWTKQMVDQTERFVANGCNLIVLSGNTCYRQVRLGQNNRRIVFYKYAGADPNPDSEVATVAWAEPPVNRPQNHFLGIGFTDGAFSAAVEAPYEIRFPSHWVFEGVTFPPGSAPATVPLLSYETDAAAFVDEDEGYPRVTGADGTPLSYVVLGSADLRSWSKPGWATMGLYSRNGTVFNAATTDWIGHLYDPILSRITRNVFDRLQSRVPWDWEQIGHANSGCALTSLGDRLFIATSENKLWRRYPVEADVPWREIGHANNVMALAGSGDTLFCLTTDNRLWWRPAVEFDTPWTPVGTGPAGGTKALAAIGGMLYAIDVAGAIRRTPARRSAPSWQSIPSFTGADTSINAMAAHADILFASTSDHRLLRSDRDFINECSGWTEIHHCNFSVGLAVVNGMLFVATNEDLLWRLDLHGLRHP